MGKRIQKLALKNLASKVLNLGYVGENEHTQIIIDCSEVLWDYSEAVASVVVQPPRGDMYPVEVTRDGETLFTAAVRGVRLTAGSLTGEAVLEVPEDVNLTRPATVTAKAALFDRTVELASAELKAD